MLFLLLVVGLDCPDREAKFLIPGRPPFFPFTGQSAPNRSGIVPQPDVSSQKLFHQSFGTRSSPSSRPAQGRCPTAGSSRCEQSCGHRRQEQHVRLPLPARHSRRGLEKRRAPNPAADSRWRSTSAPQPRAPGRTEHGEPASTAGTARTFAKIARQPDGRTRGRPGPESGLTTAEGIARLTAPAPRKTGPGGGPASGFPPINLKTAVAMNHETHETHEKKG